MIASLEGVISAKQSDGVVLEAGGVGYEIFLTSEDLSRVHSGGRAKFLIYEQIREDAHNLYGFSEADSKQLFAQLLGVSGVGPKVALGILSSAGAERLRQAIAAGDPDLLKGIAGVGKKTAERVVVELKSKVQAGLSAEAPVSQDTSFQALVQLGYTPVQAAGALAKLPADLTGDQERLKAALKEIGQS